MDAFLREYAGAGPGWPRPKAFLVEQWGGGLAGLAPTAAMEAVPPMQRFQVRAIDFALPCRSCRYLPPKPPAGEVVLQMDERGARWALVVAGGQIVGVLSIERYRRGSQAGEERPAVDWSSWSLTRG